jgi:hypothetical protein
MLLDTEGWGLSTNYGDYVTYGILSAASASLSSTYPGAMPFGDVSLDCGINNTIVRPIATPIAAGSTLYYGARLSPYGNNGAKYDFYSAIEFMDSAGNPQLIVALDNVSGAVRVSSGTGTQLGQSADAAFPANLSYNPPAFMFLEVGLTLGAGGTGACIIKCNGVQVLDLTGITTQTTAVANISATAYHVAYNSNGGRLQVMHQYWCDGSGAAPNNTFLGDVRVQVLRPTANDAVTFTPHGGTTNYANAATVPPVPATDYNASGSGTGDQDTFTTAGMSSTLGQVFGVSVKSLVAASDAGAKSAQNVLKSGTSTTLGASTSLGTVAKPIASLFATDPATGAQWLAAGVNAAKLGYRVSA